MIQTGWKLFRMRMLMLTGTSQEAKARLEQSRQNKEKLAADRLAKEQAREDEERKRFAAAEEEREAEEAEEARKRAAHALAAKTRRKHLEWREEMERFENSLFTMQMSVGGEVQYLSDQLCT